MTFPHTNITSSTERSLFNTSKRSSSSTSLSHVNSFSRNVLKANASTVRYLMHMNNNLSFQIENVTQHISLTKEAFARITVEHNCKWYFNKLKQMNVQLKEENELLRQKAEMCVEQLQLNIKNEMNELTQAKNTAFVCENALYKKDSQIHQLKKSLMNVNVIRENRKEVYDDDQVYTKEQRKDIFRNILEYFQRYLAYCLNKVSAVKKANDKKEEIIKVLKGKVQQEKIKGVMNSNKCNDSDKSDDDNDISEGRYDVMNVSDIENEDKQIWTNISLDDNNNNDNNNYDYYVHNRTSSNVTIPKLDLKQITYNNHPTHSNKTKLVLKIQNNNNNNNNNKHNRSVKSMTLINDLPFSQLH